MVLALSAVIITFRTSNLLPWNLEGIGTPKGESTFPDTGSPVGRSPMPHHGGTAISWLRSARLSWVGQGCLEQPTSLGSAVGQPLKKKQKRHLCRYSQSRPLGKDQRTCLSAFFFPSDTALSSTSAFRNWGRSSPEAQGDKVCYARCESAQKMLLGSYEMEINFSGHFSLMMVLIIVLFK